MGRSVTAILAFTAFSLVLTTSEAIYSKPENSLSGPYVAGGPNLAWWDLTGSAVLAGTVIRLTTDEPEKQGAIWNNFPNIMNDWEFHIQLHIHGKGVNLNGEGMAIWYVREPLLQGPIFGYKDRFNGLGLFIDTFEDPSHPHNHKHPYLSVVINDGSQHYEHHEDGTANQIGGCHLPVRNLEWPVRLAVSYISQTLSVFTDAEGLEQWSECFSSPGVQLPTGYYFGVSASTEVVTDNHDVVSITTLDMTPEGKFYEDRTHVIPHAQIVQIPARPRSSEEISEEELQKVDIKREVHQDEIMAEPAELHQKQESHPEPEKHHHPELEKHQIPEVLLPPQHKHEAEEPKPKVVEEPKPKKVEEPKVEPQASETEASKPASFWRKAFYIAGIGVLLYVAVSMFRSYMANRRERIQKRLY
ncbi:hypothetical protein JTE90_017081 [Oedothorax gibbosus]|uniref:L-type lectin-like domain-containing protein n=1 Tax=Oedothorax gibbosus TaxID=931172 RepID=A0AAV6ULF9_9ARAC|nr:hypothetical protein JTE90_017081 [Oedothorax gibbosus]